MTFDDISKHLVADWVPSLPVDISSLFVGWPPYLLQSVNKGGLDLIAIGPEASRSERQWKSFLSWMLGVAGARHALAEDGYTWVAPLSAFYDNAIQEVDVSRWHRSFPPSILKATSDPTSQSRLRPDYIALREVGGEATKGYDWAVVEAKGTGSNLSRLQTCPTAWSRQARNVTITVNDQQQIIPRHIVVATRTNSNARKLATRSIQLRAWNRRNKTEGLLIPPEAAVEVVAAYLFGVFKATGLVENARAIALSVYMRGEKSERSAEQRRLGFTNLPKVDEIASGAEDELRQFYHDGQVRIPIRNEWGPAFVYVPEPLITLARKLRNADKPGTAAAALRVADSQLASLKLAKLTEIGDISGKVALSPGVEFRFEKHER